MVLFLLFLLFKRLINYKMIYDYTITLRNECPANVKPRKGVIISAGCTRRRDAMHRVFTTIAADNALRNERPANVKPRKGVIISAGCTRRRDAMHRVSTTIAASDALR
jgi:hypothetical protein